jgi:Lar family restriction alleviation protein
MTTEIKHTTTLKPCPFCGGEAKYFVSNYPDTLQIHNVRCDFCYEGFDGHATKEGVFKAWNTRSVEDALVEALVSISEISKFPECIPAFQLLQNISATAKQALKQAGVE